MTHYVLGIDVGGSGTRGVLARVDPDGLSTVASSATNVVTRVDATGIVFAELAENVIRVIGELCQGRTHGIDAVAIGCTGLIHQGEQVRDRLPAHIASTTEAKVVVLSSDTLTSYLGGLGWRSGAVIAVGTGVVAVGTDMAGLWRRVDGWGYNLGDVGGGSWIGRRGLDAGLRAFDGRTGGSDMLLERMLKRFGPPIAMAGQLARRDDRAALLASFAPDVLLAADEGDARSIEIITEAGIHLADTAVAALPPGCDLLSAVGSLIITSAMLFATFREQVRRYRSDIQVAPPAGNGSNGAALLAARALESGLPPGAETLGAQMTRYS